MYVLTAKIQNDSPLQPRVEAVNRGSEMRAASVVRSYRTPVQNEMIL